MNSQQRRGGKSQQKIQGVLDKIFQAFAEKQIIDLHATREKLIEEKFEGTAVFLKKIERAPKSRMSRKQFNDYFSQDCLNPDHFSVVFDMIDTDGTEHINKSQLEELNIKYGLGLSRQEMDQMIEAAASDGQKVSKRELAELIRENI